MTHSYYQIQVVMRIWKMQGTSISLQSPMSVGGSRKHDGVIFGIPLNELDSKGEDRQTVIGFPIVVMLKHFGWSSRSRYLYGEFKMTMMFFVVRCWYSWTDFWVRFLYWPSKFVVKAITIKRNMPTYRACAVLPSMFKISNILYATTSDPSSGPGNTC